MPSFDPVLLKELRQRQGWSQEQLASRLGVSFATVNRWEGGKSAPQRAQRDAIDKLAEEYGVTLGLDLGRDSIGYAATSRGQTIAAGALLRPGSDADNSSSSAPATPPAKPRRGLARSTVLGTRSMEQMLWDAACSIRGEKDAPKFKDYLLPLVFLKRLSDVFDDELARLSETYGDAATARELVEADPALVRFYVPPEARWPVLSGREPFAWPADQRPASLGEHLTTACRAVARASALADNKKSLVGIIDQVDFAHVGAGGERDLSDAALRGVIETLSDPRYRLGLKDVEPDFLGRCYEYLLRKFAEGSGQSAGEFFTPTEVGFLMAEILRPRPREDAYDYACGSAGLLIKLQLVAEKLDPAAKKLPLRLHGQELQSASYAVAWMNVIIHDLEAEILRGDSMRNPKFRAADGTLKKFPLIVANPMWNQPFDPAVFEHDAFDRFERAGGSTTGKGDWAWLQHTAASLAEGGRAAVVLDTGAVSRGSGSKNEDRERAIRRHFVEQDLIDGVILLPDNLFYNTTAPGVVVFLRRGKPRDRAGKITLVNAAAEAKKGAPKNYLPMEGVKKIAAAYHAGADVPGFVKVITAEEAAANDYNLSPSRYVAAESTETHRELPEIRAALAALDAKASALHAELQTALDQIA